MAMLEILNSVRRIVHKWVNTASRVSSQISPGDSVIYVEDVYRFSVGDTVMLRNNEVYEADLVISEIDINANSVTLSAPVLNGWVVTSSILVKTMYGHFVQGIYIGDRDVLPRFPCITVNGVSRSSEWFTLGSSKERYEIELGIYVQESTQEEGYKFLLTMTDIIQKGLKRNIMPLVDDYNIVRLDQDVNQGDLVIYVNNRQYLEDANFIRIFLEDEYNSQENWVEHIYTLEEDPTGKAIKLSTASCFDFDADETSLIIPNRHIFNSWPNNIQYGHIHKGELLKAAKISWFAEEQELQIWRRQEPKLR